MTLRLLAASAAWGGADRLGAVRVLVGLYALGYLLVYAGGMTGVTALPASDFTPVGPVALLSAPLAPPLVLGAWAVAVLAGAAFVVGWRFAVSGPLFAATFLWVTSYRTSFGMLFHSDNLVALHLVGLALAPAAAAFSLDARRLGAPPPRPYATWVWLLCATTACTYLIAGVSKLRLSGMDWIDGAVLHSLIAHDTVRKAEVGSIVSPLAAWLAPHRAGFAVLAAVSVLVELGAPLTLLWRRAHVVWAVLAWSFHVGVLLLMAIAFPYPLLGFAYAASGPAERLVFQLRRLWLRRLARVRPRVTAA